MNKNKSYPKQTATIRVNQNQTTICCPSSETSRWNSHPRVYLELGKFRKVSCPYCGTLFIID